MTRQEQRIREQIAKYIESKERTEKEIKRLDIVRNELLDDLDEVTAEMEILESELKFEQDKDKILGLEEN